MQSHYMFLPQKFFQDFHLNMERYFQTVSMHVTVSQEIFLKDIVEKVLKEYLNFLNISLGSSGEFHSSYYSFYKAEQITEEEYERLDELHYKTENQLIKLIEKLQKKKNDASWEDEFV